MATKELLSPNRLGSIMERSWIISDILDIYIAITLSDQIVWIVWFDHDFLKEGSYLIIGVVAASWIYQEQRFSHLMVNPGFIISPVDQIWELVWLEILPLKICLTSVPSLMRRTQLTNRTANPLSNGSKS